MERNLPMQNTIKDLLNIVVERNASDLHLLADTPPVIRVNGVLIRLEEHGKLTAQAVEELAFSLITPEQKELILVNKELDFSVSFQDEKGNVGRFRANIYYQRGALAIEYRYIPPKIPTIDELSLPKILYEFTKLRQGFILVTGPTGHGKTTTLASMLNEINTTRSVHIITIEDPIEYVFTQHKSIISQREMHTDTHSWDVALRSVLREDPDVVLIGEMRDTETIAAALTIAETGHLVFATLHTNSASQTVDRIVNAFPQALRDQVSFQLAATFEGIISQRLVPGIEGGRLPAVEVILGNQAVKTNVREGKSHLLDNIVQTSGSIGMISLESSLAKLVKEGKITLDTAQFFSLRPDELMRLI